MTKYDVGSALGKSFSLFGSFKDTDTNHDEDAETLFNILLSKIPAHTYRKLLDILKERSGHSFLRTDSGNGSIEYGKLLSEMWDLHCRKNAGYSGKDSDRWANFRLSEKVGVPAWKGALIRLSDKFIRVCNLAKDPDMDKVGESIRDTLVDLAAYALIIVCLLDEEKK